MALGLTTWATAFNIGSFEEFKSEVSPFWPETMGWILHFDEEQTLRIAYNGGDNNPLAQAAYVGLVVRKRMGLLDDDARSAVTRAAEDLRLGEMKMPVLVVPGVVRVAIKAVSGGEPVVNVVAVRKTGSGGAAEASAAVKAAWEGAGKPTSVLIPAYALQEYEAMDLSTADGAIASTTSATAGSGSGLKSANSTCALVKWNGASRARSSRGRLYLGPMTEANIADDGRTLAAAAVTAINNAFTQFRNSLSTAGFPLVVVSSKFGTATDVTSHSVATIIATQRRRVR